MTTIRKEMPWANLPKSRPEWLRDIRVPSRVRPDPKVSEEREKDR